MKYWTLLPTVGLALCLLSPLAMAREAHICTTRPFAKLATPQATQDKPLPLNDKTVFTCPRPLGDKTIPQLAKQGWKITQLQLVPQPAHPGKRVPTFTWKILIQKPSLPKAWPSSTK